MKKEKIKEKLFTEKAFINPIIIFITLLGRKN